jgi:phosphoglucomutase
MESSRHYKISSVPSTPFMDQNPGTSGLRKKVSHFRQKNYIENFVQSIFLAHDKGEFENKSLVIGGDGRFYNNVATNIIIKISAANGIKKIIVAENGIMSTPAVSLLVRSQPANECFGAIILTASHNPGGENEDLGIKFNNNAGAPAPEAVTDRMFKSSKEITEYKTIDFDGEFSLKDNTKFHVAFDENDVREVSVEIESTTRLYLETMQKLFDFKKLQSLFDRNDFKFTFDAMHGASGPYAFEIFNKVLGVDLKNLHNCDSLEDFGGLHPDPNLVYAKKLVQIMDINNTNSDESAVPDFGAACDGDADRNMILGKRFYISPNDSVAIIAANYKLIPNLNRERGLKGVARSMPTSGALDRVATKLGIKVTISIYTIIFFL